MNPIVVVLIGLIVGALLFVVGIGALLTYIGE